MAGNAMSLSQLVKVFLPLLSHLGWFEPGDAIPPAVKSRKSGGKMKGAVKLFPWFLAFWNPLTR